MKDHAITVRRSQRPIAVSNFTSYCFIAVHYKIAPTSDDRRCNITYNSTLCLKKRHTWYCPYLCQMLTDLQNFFTIALSGQLTVKWILNIRPRFNCVGTVHYHVKYKLPKITIIYTLKNYLLKNMFTDFILKVVMLVLNTFFYICKQKQMILL